MSRSSATTPVSRFSSLGVFPLAGSPAERYYRLLLALLILLLGVCWSSYLSGAGLFALAASPLLLTCSRAFNYPHQKQLLRHQDGRWWLGQGSQWQLLTITGEALVTRWCVRASFVDVGGRRVTLWLWRRGRQDHQHRRLRVSMTGHH